MQKNSGKLLPNPLDEETVEDGDQLIVIGTITQLASLERTLEESKPSQLK